MSEADQHDRALTGVHSQVESRGHGLQPPAFNDVLVHARRQRLYAGQSLDIRSRDSSVIYAIREGILILDAEGGTDAKSVLAILFPGEAISAETCPPGCRMALSARTPADVLIITAADIPQPDLVRDISRKVARQCAAFALHHIATTTLVAEARVATLLIDLALRSGLGGTNVGVLQIPLSRLEMASHLALNADTLSRIMSQLRSKGVVEQLSRERMAIRDWTQLCEMSPLAECLKDFYGSKI